MHGRAGGLIVSPLGSCRDPCHPGYVEHRAIHYSALVSPRAPSESIVTGEGGTKELIFDQGYQRTGGP
jgi:hypothetical protein